MKSIINDIPSREAFLRGDATLEIGYPWLTYGAIMALEYLVKGDFKVLEFGCGGSTVFWANNCSSVKSFETNFEWLKKTQKRLEGYTNVELILATQTQMLEAISKMPNNFYDLVLVDSEPRRANRLILANAISPKIKRGGWLVLDNYEKYQLKEFDFGNWYVYTFDDIVYGGCGTKICQKIK